MRMSHNMKLGALLAIIAGAAAIPVFFQSASAAQLSNLSMTASSTERGAVSNYILRYTATNAATAGQTITIALDSVGSNYSIGALVFSDIVATGMTVVNTCTSGGDEVQLTTFTNNPDVITLTVCGTATVPAGAKVISIGNNRITNPAAAGSYKVRVAGSQTDSGETVVAILDRVTVSAAVDATLLFSVAGVASGGTVNGETISTSSSAIAIGFGLLASGTPIVAAQDLTVTTNAANGYVVSVHEDQDLTAGNGAKIHLFKDGSQVATPTAWTNPSATLGSVNTYGHFGLTSDDTDLNANEFFSGSAIKWAGNFSATSTRTVLSNSGPADGTTQNIGKARVGYKIQITSLQAAGSDYTNHLIYVCTPTF